MLQNGSTESVFMKLLNRSHNNISRVIQWQQKPQRALACSGPALWWRMASRLAKVEDYGDDDALLGQWML